MPSTAMKPETSEEIFFDENGAQYRDAIAAEYYENPERLDIRTLWNRDGVHYFRVNWWKLRENLVESYIARSVLVAVDETQTGLRVREVAPPKAA